ncbi:MAG: sigma 54-interacting transcriptional regulator [Fibrobacteria bacterium]|nr:sigma 54-interacting transcriptional regulator [Fibrobacteria bacterium]
MTVSNLEQAKQETILNCVADGVFTVDNERKIQFFNRAAERITGFKAGEAIGKKCSEIFRPSICGNACTLAQVEQTGRDIINQPVKIYAKTGRSVHVSVSAAVLRDEANNIIGGVETFRDLSTEEDLRRQIKKSYTFQDIISRHPRMHDIFSILPDIAGSEVCVLIEGESGTGKELFARAIHNLSPRKEKPFIAINCGSLPDSLLESELFGYKKGAFTDAKKDKPGRFDLAKGGSLFLDEIGDVSPALQVKLLRVLQEKMYEPLGAIQSVHANARIIAATNQSLQEKMKAGEFRDDLYYRLNVLRLEIPPLRERRCDVPILIDHFRRCLNTETGKNIEAVDETAIDLLMGYDFPGNVRELENVIQHAFVLCKNSVIRVEHLPRELTGGHSVKLDIGNLSLEAIEKRAIKEALLNNKGNQTKAARQLKIDASTLYRKMKRYKLKH